MKLQLILTFILDYFLENVSILFIVVYSVYFTISISWCLHLKGWTLRTDSQCWQCIVIMLEKYFFLFWFWFGWYKRCLDIAKVCLYQLIAKIWHKPTNHWFTFSNLLLWCDNLIPCFPFLSKIAWETMIFTFSCWVYQKCYLNRDIWSVHSLLVSFGKIMPLDLKYLVLIPGPAEKDILCWV